MTDKRQPPAVLERIYIHPTSAEYHLNKGPQNADEYIEYVRVHSVDDAQVAGIRERQKQRQRFKRPRPNPRWPDPEPDINYLLSLLPQLSSSGHHDSDCPATFSDALDACTCVPTISSSERLKDGGAADRGCVCLYGEPCDSHCTCIKPFSSRGCAMCCSYGSLEQRRERAKSLLGLIRLGAAASTESSEGFHCDACAERYRAAAGRAMRETATTAAEGAATEITEHINRAIPLGSLAGLLKLDVQRIISKYCEPKRHYFCSCGGALTAEEYIEHYFERGHDRGGLNLDSRYCGGREVEIAELKEIRDCDKCDLCEDHYA